MTQAPTLSSAAVTGAPQTQAPDRSPLLIWLVENGEAFNRGCEAITRSTVGLIRGRFPNAAFKYWSRNHAFDVIAYRDLANFEVLDARNRWGSLRIAQKLHRMGGVSRHLSSAYLKQVHHPAVVLALGGDNYSLDFGFSERHLTSGRMFTAAGIPFIIWGSSIGPFTKNPAIEKLMPKFLSSLGGLFVREPATTDYLASIGVSANVTRVWDPAFTLETQEYTGPCREFIDQGSILGFNISALISRFHDNNHDRLIQQCADFAKKVAADGHRVLLVPHVSAPGRPLHENDHEFLARVAKAANLPGSVRLLEEGLNTCQTKWVISKCRFFMGARTHATIAAISSGVPTISIAYSMKAKGLNREIFGSERYVLESDKVRAGTLLESFQRLVSSESEIRGHLADTRPTMVAGARNAVTALEAIIKKSAKH